MRIGLEPIREKINENQIRQLIDIYREHGFSVDNKMESHGTIHVYEEIKKGEKIPLLCFAGSSVYLLRPNSEKASEVEEILKSV